MKTYKRTERLTKRLKDLLIYIVITRMPKKNPEERKEYNRQQYLKNKYNDKHCKTREEYILNFYSTIKTEYEFMMWVRNIKRVHKEYFSRESEKDCKIPQNTFIELNET